MTPDLSPQAVPQEEGPTTTPVLGRARHRGRLWSPPARTLLASCSAPIDAVDAQGEPEAPVAPGPDRHFLTIDNRFGTPIHVFLESDPSSEVGFPGFRVRYVTLEGPPASPPGVWAPAAMVIGQNPHHLERFRLFRTDRAVTGAGFILIEPRYVGPNWPAYILAFRPGGEKPGKRPVSDDAARRR